MDNNSREQSKTRRFTADLKRRLSEVKATRWVRFGIVSLLFFLFVIWIANPWLLLLWFLLADIYITSYIPWTWWKTSKKSTRRIMSWVDAIVYALVLVYIIFAFIGQQYKIPSSSLEKSLLVGDYLWVNKTTYGPRVPNTLLHFPFALHTMPIVGGKSYLDHPEVEYHRLPGFRSVERGDIVVFNFPEGDTVLSLVPDADYYMIAHQLRQQGHSDPLAYIKANKAVFGDVLVRPVDRRENYVKRVIGLPGERIQLVSDTVYINGKPIGFADNVQFNYIIPVTRPISDDKWLDLGVRREDHGSGPIVGNELAGYMYYRVPLTAQMKAEVEKWPEVGGPLLKENIAGFYDLNNVWPLGNPWDWTRADTDEFWIPKRGKTLHVTLDNLPLYRRAIETYEGNTLQVKDGKIYINGEDNPYYTFKMDYYWMMGDNRDMSLDSRYFGLVPEDHVVGTPQRILYSIDEERQLLDANKIRWNRIFSNPNPDKEKAAEKNWK
ncbi:MAG: signal peptidase I [Muribaculaceae bacterium]|nr:signal peptidase I [Muribaculaceae bacterium]